MDRTKNWSSRDENGGSLGKLDHNKRVSREQTGNDTYSHSLVQNKSLVYLHQGWAPKETTLWGTGLDLISFFFKNIKTKPVIRNRFAAVSHLSQKSVDNIRFLSVLIFILSAKNLARSWWEWRSHRKISYGLVVQIIILSKAAAPETPFHPTNRVRNILTIIYSAVR